MKITPTLLSIPPFISTSWENVVSIQSRPVSSSFTLLITLKSGSLVEIPHLDKTTVDEIFEAHTRYSQPLSPISFSLPFTTDGPAGTFDGAMQHNPEQSNLPDLPPQILDRMATIAKALGIDDAAVLPQPETGCNCIYCQVARALSQTSEPEEEIVTEADLHFRDWEVTETAPHLYHVSNPLDPNEHYSVFLGTPIGCTCGKTNCEHIKSVLNS